MVFFACGRGKLTVDKNVNKNTKDVAVYDTDDLTYEKADGSEVLDFVAKNQKYFTPFYNDEKQTVEMCMDYAVVHTNIQFYRHENLMLVFALKGVCCFYVSPTRQLYVNGKKYLDRIDTFTNPYMRNGELTVDVISKNVFPCSLEELIQDKVQGITCSDLVLYKRKAEIELDSAVNYMFEGVDVSSLF